MANNPYVNKVVYGNQTVMDISDTDATESDVVSGKTFYKGSGARSAGTANYYSPNDSASTDIANADLIPFYDDSASAKKNSTWSNIKSVLKTYFDSLFDTFPRLGSSNPVTSEGIYNAVSGESVVTEDTIGYIIKNLWDVEAFIDTQTINGVTFTVIRNADNHVLRIKVRGTASADATFSLGNAYLEYGKNYILSGAGDYNYLSEDLYLSVNTGSTTEYDYGDGVEFTPYNVGGTVVVRLTAKQGFDNSQTLDYFVYPMIRKAEVVNAEFVPYSGDETVLDKLNNVVDTKVTQTASSGDSDYEVLFSGTADNTTRTEGARKASNLLFNPSTGNLQATQLNGATIGSSPKFTDTVTTVYNGLDSTSTANALSAAQGRILNLYCYRYDDTAETDIADSDRFPFYDASASAKRRSTWSNIKSVLKTYFDTLYKDITVTSVTSDIYVSVSTGNSTAAFSGITKQGYTAILAIYGGNNKSAYIVPASSAGLVSSKSVSFMVRNISSSAISSVTYTCYIIWKKT